MEPCVQVVNESEPFPATIDCERTQNSAYRDGGLGARLKQRIGHSSQNSHTINNTQGHRGLKISGTTAEASDNASAIKLTPTTDLDVHYGQCRHPAVYPNESRISNTVLFGLNITLHTNNIP